jgi:hypothetical protein
MSDEFGDAELGPFRRRADLPRESRRYWTEAIKWLEERFPTRPPLI